MDERLYESTEAVTRNHYLQRVSVCPAGKAVNYARETFSIKPRTSSYRFFACADHEIVAYLKLAYAAAKTIG